MSTPTRIEGVQYLHAAAATLRAHAAAATPGLWDHMCLGSEGCLVLRRHGTLRERGRGRVARFGCKDWQSDHADAAYVAMMAPPVAAALAGWLEVKAANPGDHDYGYALAVAGAVNAATCAPQGNGEYGSGEDEAGVDMVCAFCRMPVVRGGPGWVHLTALDSSRCRRLEADVTAMVAAGSENVPRTGYGSEEGQ